MAVSAPEMLTAAGQQPRRGQAVLAGRRAWYDFISTQWKPFSGLWEKAAVDACAHPCRRIPDTLGQASTLVPAPIPCGDPRVAVCGTCDEALGSMLDEGVDEKRLTDPRHGRGPGQPWSFLRRRPLLFPL